MTAECAPPADDHAMTKVAAIHFEAKKHAYRQTQDGIVVSFVIHPDDVNADFAVAALGTRYMVALAKIGDDEQVEPIKPQKVSAPANDKPADFHGVPSEPERKRWHELSLPQQIGIRCNDPRFIAWLGNSSADGAAKSVRVQCAVTSRAEIQPGTEAARLWAQLESDFLQATGQIAVQF